MKIDGNTLIGWGYKQGKYFKDALAAVDVLARENHFGGANHTEADMRAVVDKFVPAPIVTVGLQDPANVPLHLNIDADTDFEKDNLVKAVAHMEVIRKVPTIRALALQPDACPSGTMLGTIPVGGVAVAENAIHPGYHSADICCSVAISVLPDDTNPTLLLDAGMKIAHFGKGGRAYSHDMRPSQDLLDSFERNPFLTNKGGVAEKHFATSGDGNHFYYVGRLQSTGQIALVTHFGSRKPGAMLYQMGIEAAIKQNGLRCPEVDYHNMWIDYSSQEGQDYWDALQLIRQWTKTSHFALHDAIAKCLGLKVKDRYWNEHNFVFKRSYNGKDYFVHAKGATPAYAGFSNDNLGKTLIPLNMSAPILISQVNENRDYGMNFAIEKSLGFTCHGAGRNYSRSEFTRNMVENGVSAKQMIADVTAKFDIRAYSGKHDISEFPGAYKNADQIIASIKKNKLGNIIDQINPLGSIMAGRDGVDYKDLKRQKKERREKLEQGF